MKQSYNSRMRFEQPVWSLLTILSQVRFIALPARVSAMAIGLAGASCLKMVVEAALVIWSTGLTKNWQAKLNRPLSLTEQAAYRRNVKEARKRVEEDRQRQYSEAAKKAQSIWENAKPAPDNHFYLIKKEVKATECDCMKVSW